MLGVAIRRGHYDLPSFGCSHRFQPSFGHMDPWLAPESRIVIAEISGPLCVRNILTWGILTVARAFSSLFPLILLGELYRLPFYLRGGVVHAGLVLTH
jgi:hypothetical protein